MIQSIDHLNVVVTDMARSLKFYCDVLGFANTKEAQLTGDWIERIVGLKGVCAHAVFIEAPRGGPRIELLHYETPAGVTLPENSRANTPGLRHFALRVSNIGEIVDKLRAAGVAIFSDPVRVPGGVVEFEAGATKTLVYFLDPDGVIIELAEYR
jgi:catechol 2,3-dioxygenase-like lactoylglutathione lyase family enzyme